MAGPAIAKQLASRGVKLTRVSATFALPKNSLLVDQWNDVTTTARTWVTLTLAHDRIQVWFDPALLIDVQWPKQNVHLRGFDYFFGEPKTHNFKTTESGGIFSSTSNVKNEIDGKIRQLVRGTPLNKTSYNPLKDPNSAKTLRQLKQNFSRTPSSSGVSLKDMTGLSASASFYLRRPIKEVTSQGGLEIPSGSSLTVTANLGGSAADVVGKSVRVNSVDISGSSIFILHEGKRVINVGSIIVSSCAVKVAGLTAVPGSSLDKARGAEATLRLFFLVLGDSSALNGGLYMPKKDVEAALTKALRKMYRAHRREIRTQLHPSINIDRVFGACK